MATSTLIVAPYLPWPAHGGTQIRLDATSRGLAESGPVDVLVIRRPHAPEPDPADAPGWIRSVRSVALPEERPAIGRAQWCLPGSLPWSMTMLRNAGARRRLDAGELSNYDLIWVTETAMAVGLPPVTTPVVLDLNDLEDEKLRTALRIDAAESGSLGRRLRRVRDRVDLRRWSRLIRSFGAKVDRLVVCSDEDARRLGLANVTVIPNTYPTPARPAGLRGETDPDTILIQGNFGYGPNADGATWFIEHVLPEVRRAHPTARLRLAGRASDRLGVTAEGVVATGAIPEMEPELARAAVAVAPIRYGSGTRLKILESFAHHLPVVATTLGAEGLGAEDGRHLLLADTPEQFAEATVALLRDPERRAAIAEGGARLHAERYSTAAAAGLTADLAARTIDEAQARPPARL